MKFQDVIYTLLLSDLRNCTLSTLVYSEACAVDAYVALLTHDVANGSITCYQLWFVSTLLKPLVRLFWHRRIGLTDTRALCCLVCANDYDSTELMLWYE